MRKEFLSSGIIKYVLLFYIKIKNVFFLKKEISSLI